MRRRSALFALATYVLAGCGARTGFDTDVSREPADSDASESTDSDASESSGSVDGVFCAINVGPVPSCDVPASDGAVQRCNATFRHCVNAGGQWGCCNGESNNNGAGGSCLFPIGFCQ